MHKFVTSSSLKLVIHQELHWDHVCQNRTCASNFLLATIISSEVQKALFISDEIKTSFFYGFKHKYESQLRVSGSFVWNMASNCLLSVFFQASYLYGEYFSSRRIISGYNVTNRTNVIVLCKKDHNFIAWYNVMFIQWLDVT